MADWIPANDAAFDVFYENLINYVNIKCGGTSPEWTHIPLSARTELQGGYAVWRPRYVATLGPHTSIETQAKNEAKAAAKDIIRPFANNYLREGQKAVTNEDRMAMKVPNKDTKPTHRPRPTRKPVTDGEPAGKGRHRVTCIDPETESKKRPADAAGVAFAHWVRHPDEPRPLPDKMPSVYQKKTVRDFPYTEDQYGMVADYATAYEAPDGSRGPWSDTVSLVIS